MAKPVSPPSQSSNRSARNLALGIGILAVGGIAVWFLLREPTPELPASLPEGDSLQFDRFYFKDMRYTAFRKDRKLYTITAEELAHRKLKLGPLTVNPVKEIFIVGLRLDIYSADLDGEEASGGTAGENAGEFSLPLARILEGAFSSWKLGYVSRVRMKGIKISFLPGLAGEVWLAADQATVKPPDAIIAFSGKISLRFAGEELSAEDAEWFNDRGALRVHGDYQLRTREGDIHSGTNGIFRLGKVGDGGGILRER